MFLAYRNIRYLCRRPPSFLPLKHAGNFFLHPFSLSFPPQLLFFFPSSHMRWRESGRRKDVASKGSVTIIMPLPPFPLEFYPSFLTVLPCREEKKVVGKPRTGNFFQQEFKASTGFDSSYTNRSCNGRPFITGRKRGAVLKIHVHCPI